jgi:cytochrome c-type biogenesis protein CcmH
MLFVFGIQVYSADIPFEFEQADQQQRYQKLIEEIRCLVCQNQSLADSNAGLAQDLRQEVYEMISTGMDDREITDFLVKRYGDFVLFRPPVKGTTWLLWFAPFIFLITALIAVIYFVRGQATNLSGDLGPKAKSKLSDMVDDANKEKT